MRARLLTGLVATLLLLGGVAVAILLGPDDTWGGEPAALPDSAPVIATAPQLLNVAGIDLVVSAILMSMGMMMVPPTVVALPFKLAFFVAVDGWGLIAAALVRGYQGGG